MRETAIADANCTNRENRSNDGSFIPAKENVILPRRSTPGSAGYDFYAPEEIVIPAGGNIQFKTGVIADIADGYVLLLFPRSGLGMKGIRIANTVGVIDSDYKLEIQCKLVNDSQNDIRVEKGDRYMQGVFVHFGIVDGDDPINKTRSGGMGSTGK